MWTVGSETMAREGKQVDLFGDSQLGSRSPWPAGNGGFPQTPQELSFQGHLLYLQFLRMVLVKIRVFINTRQSH